MRSGLLNIESADADPLRAVVSVSSDSSESINIAQFSISESFLENQASSQQSNLKLLSGERFVIVQNKKAIEAIPSFIYLTPQSGISAQFCATNYRISLEPDNIHFCYENKIRPEFFDIPLMMIEKFDMSFDKVYSRFEIFTKDGRSLRVDINKNAQFEYNVYETLSSYIFSNGVTNRFAFFHRFFGQIDGWKLYNPHSDYGRLGVADIPGSKWTFLDNSNWEFCKSYPEILVVPKELLITDIKASAKFRSKSRFPVLVWLNKRRKATLWRSSQPKTGIRTSRCIEDEVYLNYIAKTSHREPKLHIFDARPFINAHAQRAIGGGVENTAYYENSELHFLNIENIHAVRESWFNMFNYTYNSPPSKYFSSIEKSEWLDHLSSILQGAVSITESLNSGISVLVHCSDGWDRTSQLCSLSQLILEAHYRSLRGFAQLIEKDWVSFGHQFEIRLGHASENQNDDKRSPIFIQFLDCVYQLTVQFPTHFEFNSLLLHDLTYFSYSGRFGTFMCNNMKERKEFGVINNTSSVWTYVFENLDKYTNSFYVQGQEDILSPVASQRRFQIWHDIFSKWHADFYYPVVKLLGPQDHKEVLMRSACEGMQLYKALIDKKEKEIQELRKQMAEMQGYEIADVNN
ncbi:LOC115416316 [Blepharisma stoltei]|uniref:Myotubularin phosphatase domain-containing protein n=1 Tax=Blepharisma stoltei TaxID=1481888 RepID=A0AAU9JZA7_9CILI|nr:unnamed protein product [Blepharisma stoltei]